MTFRAVRALTESPESQAMSRDLKQRGWTFVGPMTLYAFVQAVGLVNDPLERSATPNEVLSARRRLRRSRVAAR